MRAPTNREHALKPIDTLAGTFVVKWPCGDQDRRRRCACSPSMASHAMQSALGICVLGTV